jgi:hypothetical protein
MRKAGSREVATAVISLALNLAASPAFAAPQGPPRTPARRLSELRFLVRRGDAVFITSASGDELKASVVGVDVDRDAFLVDVDEVRLELPASGIREIHLEVRDPLRNGVLIGAGIGLAATLLLVAISDDDTAGQEFLGFSLFTVPIGAGLGAAIDATHKGRELIYRPTNGGGLPFIEPLAGSRTRRLGFSITVVW